MIGTMTDAEKLLNLTIEYQESVSNRTTAAAYPGEALGREPEDIAAEYADALRLVLTS